jgi:signal transduction histidine kinase
VGLRIEGADGSSGLARVVRLALWPLGLGAGLLVMEIPSFDTRTRAAELIAGWTVVTVGLISWTRRTASRFGALMTAAGFLWFVNEWNDPQVGNALVFTFGIALYAVVPVVVAHALLSYPRGRLSSRPERLGLAAGYVGAVVLLGVGPALAFNPRSQGCAACPGNLLRVADLPGLFTALNRVGVWAGLTWVPLLAALLGVRLARSTPPLRRVRALLFVAGIAYLGLVMWSFQRSVPFGFLGDRGLRQAQAVSLVVVGLAVVWTWVRARRTRSKIAKLVLELTRTPAPGGLRDALAELLDDTSLCVAYPLADGRLVDADGRPITPGGATTELLRDGTPVAVLSHRPGLLDDPALVEEVATAAQLTLQNERLQAELNARLGELRASRARIVETGDAERARLERDLHDGSQQQLVSLLMQVGLARARNDEPVLAQVEVELHTALTDLRELARGVFPPVLSDEGLAAALQALAEEAHLRIVELPHERLPAAVEATAYFVIAQALPAHGPLTVSAVRHNDRLVVSLNGADTARLDAADRVGALGGRIEIRDDGRVRLELPCGS